VWELEDGMDSLERDALLQDVSQQNSRLQQLIEAIALLVARSREVLRRQRPEDSAPAGDGKPDKGS
jgi:hypothetical protein